MPKSLSPTCPTFRYLGPRARQLYNAIIGTPRQMDKPLARRSDQVQAAKKAGLEVLSGAVRCAALSDQVRRNLPGVNAMSDNIAVRLEGLRRDEISTFHFT